MKEKQWLMLDKLLKKENIWLLLCLGVLLFLFGGPWGKQNSPEKVESEPVIQSSIGRQNILQQEVEQFLTAMEGVGKVKVYITLKQEAVYGVLVLLDGAETPGMRGTITQMMMAAFGIDANHVTVAKLRQEKGISGKPGSYDGVGKIKEKQSESVM